VEALPDAILVHCNNKIVFVNPSGLRLLAADNAEQLLGKNVLDVTHYEYHSTIRSQILNCYSTGTASAPIEAVLIAFDGSSIQIETLAIPIRWEGSAAVQIVVHDMRHRKKKVPSAADDKFRNLFERAAHGMLRSRKDGVLLDVNLALVAMLGYDSKAELLVKNLRRDIYADPEACAWLLESCASDVRGGSKEVRCKRKDGTIVVVRMNGGAIAGSDGAITHFEVILENIAEKAYLEEQLRQAHKMEAVGLLAGGISHDFNNLLGVILGNTEMLLETSQSGAQQHFGEEIQKATLRATQLTRQLLAFSHKQMLNPTIIDLNAIVHDVVTILSRLIGEDVQLVTKLEDGLGSIRADRVQIEQILMNLAVNSRDAMPQGGKLTIQTENVEVRMDDGIFRSHIKPGHYVHLTVSDTGMGMTDDVLGHAFEPFFTTKPLGRGTGLGLATVYGIVKQTGGYICVSSIAGTGTTFDIYVHQNASTVPAMVSKTEARTSHPIGSETILVLEDDEPLRRVTCALLRSSGYKVLQAGFGDDAIAIGKERKEPLPLMISDVVLPDMSGPSIVAEMQAAHPEMRVLYISGYAEPSVSQLIATQGAVLLQKPLSRSELLQRVHEILHPLELVG
jgi:two-component system, cell cycle sensor histidine kinase and response regulator CckA